MVTGEYNSIGSIGGIGHRASADFGNTPLHVTCMVHLHRFLLLSAALTICMSCAMCLDIEA